VRGASRVENLEKLSAWAMPNSPWHGNAPSCRRLDSDIALLKRRLIGIAPFLFDTFWDDTYFCGETDSVESSLMSSLHAWMHQRRREDRFCRCNVVPFLTRKRQHRKDAKCIWRPSSYSIPWLDLHTIACLLRKARRGIHLAQDPCDVVTGLDRCECRLQRRLFSQE
jgi:hypothetical protein